MGDHLDALPGVESVFFDVDNIPYGEDFLRRIEAQLARASHVFVLIGHQWCGTVAGSAGNRLLHPGDVVAAEVSAALASQARVVPILLDDAPLPLVDDLPNPIKPLLRLQAATVRSRHFGTDMDNLLDEVIHGRSSPSRHALPPLPTPGGVLARGLAGVALGVAILLWVSIARQALSRQCVDWVCWLKNTFSLRTDAEAMGLLWAVGGSLVLCFAVGLAAWPWWRRRQQTRA